MRGAVHRMVAITLKRECWDAWVFSNREYNIPTYKSLNTPNSAMRYARYYYHLAYSGRSASERRT